MPMYINRKPRVVNRAPRPDLARGDRRVHFLHVPKCGGTTLRYVLEGYAAVRGLTSANEARRENGVSPDLSASQIVMGHDRPVEGLTRSDTCYLTVLRDPVLRLHSLVAMTARLQKRPANNIVEDLSWVQANWAVHLLTGAESPDGDPVSEAKRQLETRVQLFGFQERLDEFMAMLASLLEVDGIIYPSFQYTINKQRLDQRFDAEFEARSGSDRELYEFARDLYRDRFGPPMDPKAIERRIPGRSYLRIQAELGATSIDVSEVRFTA